MRAVAVAGSLIATAGGVLVATSDHLVHPVAYGAEFAVLVAGTAAVALCWAVARPGNRIALLLLAYTAALAVLSLQGASNPLLHSIGALFDIVAFFLGYYVVLAFPLGRVTGWLEKAILAGVVWLAVASFLPAFFFSPFVSGSAPLAKCNANCPSNALMIADNPTLAKGFGTTEEYLAAALAVAIVAVLCYRLVRASLPRRRALLPVYVPTVLLTIPFGIFHAHNAGMFSLDPDAVDTLGWFVTTGRTLLSFGFLLSIVLAMLFAGVALRTILSRLVPNETPAHLRSLVAEALDDPPLRIAFAVDAGDGNPGNRLVDSHGRPLDVTEIPPGRSAATLERRGHTAAVIVHDAALETDPELVQAAGQAVLLALESGRLESELLTKIDELRTSRERIVAAGEAERRKVERDLHDGAQQRLMAIQIKLGLLRDRIDDDELAAELDEIADDASAAVDDLRGLAQGIYPTVLLERGLAAALRHLAQTAAIPVNVIGDGVDRFAPAVEAAVYFCVLEALQNATKHAGARASATVTLARRNDRIEFAVVDDGIGFATANGSNGIGLAGMQDRVGAVGGSIEVSSAPGRGTSVRGRVPVSGWR